MKSEIDKATILSEKSGDKAAFRAAISETAEAILSSFSDESAFSGINPYELRKHIESLPFLPEEGDNWDGMMESVKDTILPHMLRTWSESYMPHLHSPALIEAIAAELIIAAFNSSMDSWDQGPSATELEVKAVRELCTLFGYNESSDGVFTSGGSQSNISALIALRDRYLERKGWDAKKEGLNQDFRKLRLYVSEISHFSFDKGAHIAGLGYNAVVKLPVDEYCRIDTVKAREIIERDIKNGLEPFMIAATIGTTDFGSIDDVARLREIADDHGLFLHADAAYGSGAILSSYSERIGNLSLADSVTIDFHKMFLLPISSSVLLVKDRTLLDTFQLHADYLNREEDEEDGYINLVGKSMQTTRRFDALKVYMSFRMRGRNGYKKILDTSIENARYFFERISSDDAFIAPIKPELSSVVFALKDGDERNKSVRRKLLSEGIVIGQTVFQGRVMLKFTLLNPHLTHEHIDKLIQRIKEI